MTESKIDLPEEDYYFEGPFLVYTAANLRKRGICCGNGCRHCPYDDDGNIVPGKGERQASSNNTDATNSSTTRTR